MLRKKAVNGVSVEVVTSNHDKDWHQESLRILRDDEITVPRPKESEKKDESSSYIVLIGLMVFLFIGGITSGNTMLILLSIIALVVIFVSKMHKPSEMMQVKIPLHLRIPNDFVHTKMYLIDGKVAVTGSVNLTFSGLNKNHETIDIKKSKEEVQKLNRAFEGLWGRFYDEKKEQNAKLYASDEMTKEEFEHQLLMEGEYDDVLENIKKPTNQGGKKK